MEYLLVQTSIDSEEAAQKLADALVQQRLAACCWVTGPFTSTYWWQGNLEHAQEWACSFKTRADLYQQIEQAIKAAHSYDTPEIIATPIAAGYQPYLNWIQNETRGQ